MKTSLRSSRNSLLALSLLVTCSGCAQLSNHVAVGPPLSLHMPEDCEAIAAPVPLPVVTKGHSAKSTLGQHRAALVNANNRLTAVRECEARVRGEVNEGVK